MLRAYIRKISNLGIPAQHKMADESGVLKRARYVEETGAIGDAWAAMMSDMRAKEDVLWVADLTVMADNRNELVDTLKTLSAKKPFMVIQEGRTGRVSLPPHDGQHMAIEAMARWSSANKAFGLLTPTEAGGKGGKKTSARRRKKRLPKSEAAKYWFDKALFHLTTDEITAKINESGRDEGYTWDWTVAALYRALKDGMRAA